MDILKENVCIFHVIDMLDEFERNSMFFDKDMYQNGEWLHAEVDYNDVRVKEMLNKVLLNIEAYRKINNEWFVHGEEDNMIGLSYLVQFCEKKFECSIMYDHDKYEFYSE